MDVEIHEVKTKGDIDEFVRYPLRLYRHNQFYVPPLIGNEKASMDPEKNPALEFCEFACWLARRNGKVVGRIGGIINRREIEIKKLTHARFTWFDFENDANIGRSLLKTVESWAISNGMDAIYGPYGFTSFDKHGLLIKGFEELTTNISVYNFPYYQDVIEQFGYKEKMDWVEFRITVPDQIPEKIERIAQIALQRNQLHVPEVKKAKGMMEYKDEFFQLLNEAYADLSGSVPLTPKQASLFSNAFFKYLNPDYVTLVLTKDNQLAAFGITVPSLSRALQKARGKLLPFGFYHLWRALKVNDTIDLMLIAVKPEFQNKGVNSILFWKLIPNYIKHHIKYVETNQNQSDNVKVQAQWKYFDTRHHKTSRSYIKYFVQ